MRFLLLSLLTTLALTANDKVALVIGNKNYTNQTGLQNPISDAKLIRDTLQGMGFEVMEVYNKNLNTLSDELDVFINRARGAKVAVIYYAGHGIGVGRNNYLIPIGASNLSVDNLGRKLMSLGELKGAVAKAKGFGVVFFDACRNSFFSGQIQGLGTGRGSRALVQPTVKRGQNILVSFSTQAGKIANDDVNNGNHSPYALALSENLNRSKDIRLVMGSVRAKVKELTSFEQIPVDENQLDGRQYCLSGQCQEQKVKVVEKIVYRDRPTPQVVTPPQPIVQPQNHSTKGITTIDGLSYQNQPFTETYTWQEAKEYCSNLTLGGYSNWRLPTRKELKKLITKEQNSGKNVNYYIRKEFVDNVESWAWFWTSEERDSSSAWVVLFSLGDDGWNEHSGTFYALCVR
jgi:hypothetical protein